MQATINVSKNAVVGTEWARERPLTPKVFATIKAEARQPGGTLSPGFAVTVNGKDFGGCCHELVLAVRPDLAPLVALHLSDLDGVPMHALANGEYWFSGILDNEVGFAYPYRPTHGRNAWEVRTPEACREIAREHFRVSEDELTRMVEGARAAIEAVPSEQKKATLHGFLAAEVEALRPRWKAEAEAGMALLRTL